MVYVQDPNVRLIRELKAEIHRLKAIISASNLVGPAYYDNTACMQMKLSSQSDVGHEEARSLLSEDIHKKEEQVSTSVIYSDNPYQCCLMMDYR